MIIVNAALPTDENPLTAWCSNDFLAGKDPEDFSFFYRGADFIAAFPVCGPASLQLQSSVVERSVDGAIPDSFGNYYIDAVHIDPQLVELGNLLSTQTFDVIVWNNHREAKTLSQIIKTGTNGITLTEPAAAPTVFQPNEYRFYSISVSTDGPPTINAEYSFNFVAYTVDVDITGKRVVVWPFVPQNGLTESIEFKTDIIKTKTAEQRISKRINPRVSYAADYFLTANEFSRIKAMMAKWGFRQFGLPVWPEMRKVGVVHAGSTSLAIDTTKSAYEVGGLVILHDKSTKFETVEIESIEAGALNFTLQTVNDYENAVAMPVVFAYLSGEVEVSRRHAEYPQASATFKATDTVDIASDVGLTQLRGIDVYLDRRTVRSNISEKLFTDCDVLDGETGVIVMAPIRDFPEHEQTISRTFTKRDDLWSFKQWLYTKRGKQKTFFLPSWNQDITATTDLLTASTSIVIKSIGYSLYYESKDLMIVTTSGDIYFYIVSSAIDNGDGTETLYLTSQVGADISRHEIKVACFLSHVRFDADRIELSYGAGGTVTVSIPVREVPE